jgi:hypothetical protein
MKMLLARRLMKARAQDSLTIDKETLITFTVEDIPTLNLSESLFHPRSSSRGNPKYEPSGILINMDAPSPDRE